MAGVLSRRPLLFRVVVGVLIYCMAGFGFLATGFSAPESSQAAEKRSTHEKQKMVQHAVADYEQGEHAKAQEGLERAKAVFPENYAVPYYLGLIYLEQGYRSGAIAQWQQYIKMDPQSENALKIRKNITLLLREQAREFAQQAAAEEATLISGPAYDKTVAVTSFSNLGSQNLGPVGKGMAAMLISDLYQVSDLQVVDRIKLQALLDEMKLGTSGLVDLKTAPKVGKLLKAKHVISGSLADLESANLMIASAVVDSDQMVGIRTQEAQGVLNQFYDLEKQIACQIIEDLGKDCDAMPAGFAKIHTKSLPALVSFSWGLDYFDQEKYDEARAMFQKALDEDPRFELAEKALLNTPTSAAMLMSTSQMISGASTSGLSSSVAGTAVAGTSVTGPAVAASVATSTVGFAPTTAIIAGAALVGGGAALAGGGGGGGSGGGGSSPNPIDLTGTWRGTWTDADGSSGEATFVLTQTGAAVSGTVSISGDECLSDGNISGTVSGNLADLTIQSGAETVALNATVDDPAKTLSGTWSYTASSSDCLGDTGNFSAALTGGADISW